MSSDRIPAAPLRQLVEQLVAELSAKGDKAAAEAPTLGPFQALGKMGEALGYTISMRCAEKTLTKIDALLSDQPPQERPKLKLDTYYEWCIEKARKSSRECDGVGGDLGIMVAVIDYLLRQADIEYTGLESYRKLASEVRQSQSSALPVAALPPQEDEATSAMKANVQKARALFRRRQHFPEDASAALPETPTWQPIETAPINASVLIFIPNAEHYGQGIYRAILVDMGTGRRWMTTGRHVGRDCGPENQPTHWMPLPDAPQAAQFPKDDTAPAEGEKPNDGAI